MADMEFDLGEALGGYEQAKADRNFYLDMMHQGQQNMGAFMASPIAAYLAGVSGVKMAKMRAKAQDIEDRRQAEKDAIAANEKLQKRRDNLDNQIVALVKGARDGSIPPSVAATMIGRLGKERGMDIKQFDADRGVLIGREPGDTEDFEWDLSESPYSKAQQNYYKTQMTIELGKQREERLAKAAEAKRKLDEQKLKDLQKGKTSSGSSSAEIRFIKENQDLFDNVFNPKSALTKRLPLEERLKRYVGDDVRLLDKWIRGVGTLSEEAQDRLGEYTDIIAELAEGIRNPQGAQLVSNERNTTNKAGTKAF